MSILDSMLSDLPFEKHQALSILATAPYRYKVYEIEKRNGKGTRVIAQPSPELKLIQRWIVARIISKWPIHSSATAYRARLSPAKHAEPHVAQRFLLKLDFENFFNSISANDVRLHILRNGEYEAEDLKLLVSALTWRNKRTGQNCISVGASSSPSLTNSIMYEFDTLVWSKCRDLGIRYSRYADDLAFSTDTENRVNEAKAIVVATLDQLEYPRLRLNAKKTISTSRQHRRTLVGLVLTPDGKISLGRENKRLLRSALFRESKNELCADERGWLRGMLAYAWSVEPVFIEAMVRRYGGAVFQKLDLPFK